MRFFKRQRPYVRPIQAGLSFSFVSKWGGENFVLFLDAPTQLLEVGDFCTVADWDCGLITTATVTSVRLVRLENADFRPWLANRVRYQYLVNYSTKKYKSFNGYWIDSSRLVKLCKLPIFFDVPGPILPQVWAR
jgi:hypothetical protein